MIQVCPVQVGLTEVDRRQLSLPRAVAHDLGDKPPPAVDLRIVVQPDAPQPGPGEVSPRQVRPAQIGPRNICPGEVSPRQVCLPEVGLSEVGPREIERAELTPLREN